MNTKRGRRITNRTALTAFVLFLIAEGSHSAFYGWNTIVVAGAVYAATAVITAFALALFN